MPFRMVAVKDIKPSGLNPRKHFDEARLAELAASMGNGVGVIEPLVLRYTATFTTEKSDVADLWYVVNRHGVKMDPHQTEAAAVAAALEHSAKHSKGFEIVAGERRWRAAQLAGLADVPAVIKAISDKQVLELMVIENDQREDIHPLEEAEGFKGLIKFGFTVEDLAPRIGRSAKYVWDRMKLLDLVPEAKTLYLENRFATGHAILLARLKPADQLRVIHPEAGGLFTHDRTSSLFDRVERGGQKPGKYDHVKPVSVRELDAWIAERVRFDVKHFAAAAPLDFGSTATKVEEAAARPGRGKKVVSITHEHFVQEVARSEERTFGPKSWKRADGQKGSKTCESAVLGVVAVGPEYGQAFEVCINKECDTHWKKERQARQRTQKLLSSGNADRQKKAREAAERREREEREKRERARTAFEAARPKVLHAIAEALKKMSPKALADVVFEAVEGYHGKRQDAIGRLGQPKTADDIVRVAALIAISNEVREYDAHTRFPKVAKRFGVDVEKLIAGLQTSAAAEQKPAAKAAKGKKR